MHIQPMTITSFTSLHPPIELLPDPPLPSANLVQADLFGIRTGLQSLLAEDSRLNAALALKLMEEVQKRGCREKVSLFARVHGLELAAPLENRFQRAEFFVRLAKLQPKDFLHYAEEALLFEESYLDSPPQQLIDIALLYAQQGDGKSCSRWLKRAKGEKHSYKQACESLFIQGLFEAGFNLIEPIEIGEEERDIIALVVRSVRASRSPTLTELEDFFLAHQQPLSTTIMVIKLLGHLGQRRAALTLAKRISYKQCTIFYLLQLADEARKEKHFFEEEYISSLRRVASRFPSCAKNGGQSRRRAFYDIVTSKKFTVDEDIHTLSYVDDPADCLEILWERACGISLNKGRNGEGTAEYIRIIDEMRDYLRKTRDYHGHPLYWVQVIRSYITLRSPEEAVKTGSLWKEWRSCLAEPSEEDFPDLRKVSDIWVLAYIGCLKIAQGLAEEGVEDLAQAHQCGDATNFHSMVREARNHIEQFTKVLVPQMAHRHFLVNLFEIS